MHACIDDGLVGPQMEASHVSVLARIYMHVAQKGVVCCLNNQFHNRCGTCLGNQKVPTLSEVYLFTDAYV